MKRRLYFADLTHTAQGIGAPTFPLGVSFVASYAMKELGAEDFAFRLFKLPAHLEEALRTDPPDMLCLSNYSWNFELAYKLGMLAKRHCPGLLLVVGGPNFPIEPDEKLAFLGRRSAIDFYIELEGEIGFVELVRKLEGHRFDAGRLKGQGELIGNCSYLSEGVPMVETTRGCPFTCAFCADGIAIKSRVKRYDTARTREELTYIAEHVKTGDEIVITDLNFGMYNEDTTTCRYIADIQERYHWPALVKASAGKNRTEKVIEAASILKGTWMIGAAIQSTDPEVLKAIKRSNISSETFEKFIEFGNSLSRDATTYSEIILAMPGDSKEKHFASLRFGVDNRVNSMRMYQAMLLVGTEMASRTCRQDYGLMTRFRTIPGCVGMYRFFGEEHPVAEIEEIIVGNSTMSMEDYLECRVMNLFVETFYNNALFEEVFNMLWTMGVSAFDFLLTMKNRPELYSPRVRKILDEFIYQTGKDLYLTREDAERVVLTPEVIGRYIGGELGINELLVHKALLYMEMEDISTLLFTAAKEILKKRNLLTPAVEEYLTQLRRFVIHRKRAIDQTGWVLTDRYAYDFNAISNLNYEIDPSTFPTVEPLEYTFFHDEDQKKHIAKQLAVYKGTPIGLGRLIQRSNLKMMYRRFQCVPVSIEAAAVQG
ncbi:MAG: cobalamin B12-binding domain-containing protein [Candidatus Omnitrophica bacterium]|nr:cobalamin B12-binding domain-containing protein [Candidatus Omnitrophota bacterium]